jgi:glycosyltransferase involved in cell wall biosynthesis
MSAPSTTRRITLLIKSLGQGGSEYQFCLLARQLHSEGFQVRILVYGSNDNFYSDLLPNDLLVESLGCNSRWNFPCLLLNLRRHIGGSSAGVAYAFLSHSNLLLLIAAIGLPIKVVCGVRTSAMDMTREPFIASLGEKLHRFMLNFADHIIVNTRKAADELSTKVVPVSIVYNGINTHRFIFDATARVDLREELGIPNDVNVIGMFGRYHPVKNHMMLLESLSMMPSHLPDCRVLFIGVGDEEYKQQLLQKAHELGVSDRVTLLDGRKDIYRYYSVLDIFCSCSDYEGFSNVLAEAMSVGLPCIATDVGEARNILDGNGFLVPPRDSTALTVALVSTLEQIKEDASMLRRASIINRFGLEASARQTVSIIENLLGD